MSSRTAIVIAADRSWFPAAAFVADQLIRLSPPADTDIVIATNAADEIEKAKQVDLACEYVLLDDQVAQGFPLLERITSATYYRIYLPRLLADRYRRILYLDADVFVHGGTVFGLLGLDMGNNAVAGARDTWVCFLDRPNSQIELRETLNNHHRKYLNAGVLLIDPARFIAESLEAKLLRLIRSQPRRLQFADQSALNIVLNGAWLELSPAFNTASPNWMTFCREVSPPQIVHFVGSVKPWHGPNFKINHPARRELELFMRRSPWASFLSKFYDFTAAWSALQSVGEPALPGQPMMELSLAEARRIANHLRTTEFADVAQGLTRLDLSRIPAGL